MARRAKERIPWGSEKSRHGKKFAERFLGQNCPDCATFWDSLHNSDTKAVCDVEECPHCGKQLLTCGHKRSMRLPKPGPGLLTFKY